MPKDLKPQELRRKLARIGALTDARAELRNALAGNNKKKKSAAIDAIDALAPAAPSVVAQAISSQATGVAFRVAWVDPAIPVTIHLFVNGTTIANATYHGGLQYFFFPTAPNQPLNIAFGATFWHGGWQYHFDMKRVSGPVVPIGGGIDPNPSTPQDDVVTITTTLPS